LDILEMENCLDPDEMLSNSTSYLDSSCFIQLNNEIYFKLSMEVPTWWPFVGFSKCFNVVQSQMKCCLSTKQYPNETQRHIRDKYPACRFFGTIYVLKISQHETKIISEWQYLGFWRIHIHVYRLTVTKLYMFLLCR